MGRAWITTPGAPALQLRAAERRGRLVGAILQPPGTAFAGTVELVIGRADGDPVVHRVPFGPGESPIDLALPPDATAVVLDPDARLPRRVPDGADVLAPIALTSRAR